MALRSTNHLRGFAIRATDGDIGKIDDFLFDDHQWTIRYVVANTGNWLLDQRVLLSPIAFRAIDWAAKCVDINLTRQQIENSPPIATDQPVSRQHEEALATYYGFPYYWGGSGLWGDAMYPGMSAIRAAKLDRDETANTPRGDPHLRSAHEVGGYLIQARDGDLGHVADFIVDDTSWSIRHLVVDTRNWWPGKHVLVAPEAIRLVSWLDRAVTVDLTRERIKHEPEYDPERLLN